MNTWTYFRLILLSFLLASCSRNPLGEDLSQPILNLGFMLSQNCTNNLNQDATYNCTVVSAEVVPDLVWSLEPETTCAWASINATTAVVTGVPNDNQVGTCQVVVVARSPTRRALPLSFPVNVLNIAPTLTIANAGAIIEDAAVAVIRTDANVQASEEGLGSYSFDHANATLPRCFDQSSSLTIDAGTGAVSYAPALNYFGTCNIRVAFNDGNPGGVVTSQFSITVTPVNDVPFITPLLTQSTPENSTANIALTVTDVDSAIACSALNVTVTSSNAALLIASGISLSGTAPNCLLALTPVAFANGTTNMTVTATDGSLSSVMNFTLNVIPFPDPPVLAPVANQVGTEDVTLTFTINATDPDTVLACDSTFFSATSSNATLLPVSNISFSGTPPTCTVMMVPLLNQNGTSNLVISLADGVNTVTRSFSAIFSPVNDAPVLPAIANQAGAEDIPLSFNFTINDVDNTLTCATSVSALSSNAALLPASNIIFSGTAPNCTATLTTLADTSGSTNLSFILTDGTLTDTENFSYVVSAVNDAPVLSSIPNQLTNEDTPIVINFTLNDVDSTVDCSTSMTATSSNTALIPVVNIVFGGTAPNCTATMSSQLNQSGLSNISFSATDGVLTAVQNFSFTVTSINDAPVLSAIVNQTTNEDTPLAINFTINDVDSALTCAGSMSATSSNTTLLPVANIVFSGTAPNCVANLSSASNLSGLTNLVFNLSDGVVVATRSFSLTVNAVNDAPVLSAIGAQTGAEGTPMAINFTLNDIDSAVTCAASVSATSSNATLLPVANITFGGTAPNCTMTISPVANQFGTTNIAVTATDGALTDIENFVLTIVPFNDPPILSAIANQTISEDGSVAVNFTITDVDNTLVCATSMSATSSSTSLLPVANVVFSGTAPNCTATMTPLANANGISNLSFTVTDGNSTDVKTFSLTVTAVNDAPILSAISNQSTSEDTPLAFNFTIADVDSTLNCSTSISATSSNAALLPVANIVFSGTAPNCTATLSPNLNATGVSNLVVTVTDGALTDVRNFTFTVNAVNDAPILSTITNQTTSEDTVIAVNFTVNDVDSVLLCTTLNLTATSSNTALLPVANIVYSGTAPNCTATFTPVSNQFGASNLSITLADNGTPNLQDVENFTFTVSAVNDAPVLSAITNQTISEDGSVAINFTLTDVDNTLTCAASVSASSSDALLLPVANIVFSGTAPNCTVTLTPVAHASGVSNLVVTASDTLLTANQSFSLTVNAVNDAPILSTIGNQSTVQDTPLAYNFTITDIDSGLNCATSITATSSNTTLLPVANIVFTGTAPNCTVTFNPANLQSGTSNVNFTLTDGALTDAEAFVFSASAVNYPPTMSAIANQTTNEDTVLAVNFTVSDVDNTLVCSTSLSATSSNVSLLPVANIVFSGTAPNCTATISSAANLNGTSNLNFTVTDGTNNTSRAFVLTVSAVNDAPVLAAIANQTTAEDTALAVNFTISDIDSTLSCTTGITATSSNATLLPVASIVFTGTAPNCTATLTPAANINGVSNIGFTLSDGALTDVKNFSLTVNPVNDAPVLSTLANQSTAEDTPLAINFTVTDIDSTLSCATSVTATSSNTALVPVAGIIFSGTAPNCTATVTSSLNSNGVSNLSFILSDGALSDTRSFTFTVTAVNDAPILSAIANQTTTEDTALAVNFTIIDVDNTLSCATSVTATSSNATLIPVANIVFNGTAPNCTATFTPTLNSSGVSNIGFTLTDGALNDVKNFTFTTTAVNDAPILSTITNSTTAEDTALAINFIINDVDSTLSCATSVTATSSNATLIPVANIVFSGTAPNCTATVTPVADLNGASNLGFTLSDGFLTDVENFTLNVTAVNDAPILSAIAAQSTLEDTALAINFTVTDIDSTLSCATSVSATSSNAVLIPVANIVFTGTAPNCTATVTPAADLSGVSNLAFTLSDGALTDAETFTFTVTAVNDAPIISVIAAQTTSEDTALAVNFTITDIDSTLTCATSVSASSSNTTLIPLANIAFSGTAPNCTATVTPVANLSGVSNLGFTVTDGALNAISNFSFTVNAVNDVPVLSTVTNQATNEDTDVSFSFTVTDIDSVLLCSTLNLSIASSNTAVLPVANVVFSGTAPNCTATLSPAPNANGNTNITLTLMDNGTPNLQDTEIFALSVSAVNDAPVISAITNQTTLEDTAIAVNFTVSDIDSTLTCATSLTASSSNAIIVPAASIVFSGTAPNCIATVTPALNQNGAVNLTLRVSDGALFQDQTFQLTVTPVNDAPVISAIADETINEDGSIVINFTITDVDSSLVCATSLSRTSSNAALLPVANIVFGGTAPNCTVTLTPSANASGLSNINLTVTDGTTPVSEALSLTVIAVNDAPVLSTLIDQSTPEDVPSAMNFTITDVDSTLSCTTSMSVLSSNVALLPVANIVFSGTAPNCTVTMTPVMNANGVSNLTFTVSDGALTSSGVINLTVNPVDDAPTISTIADQIMNEDTSMTVNFTISDIDTALNCSTSMSRGSTNTTLLPTANITFGGTAPNCTATLVPVANEFGTTNVTLTVSDATTSVPVTFKLDVNPVNDAPVLSAIGAQSSPEDTPFTINYTITDIDSILSCTTSINVTSSNVTLMPAANVTLGGTAPNCTATFTPQPNRFGSSNVSLFLGDGITTVSRTFNVAFTSVNDAPVISAIAAQSTVAGTPIAIAFTISDVETALVCSSLRLSMTSSDTVLVPTANVAWSGTVPNCTGTVTPAGTSTGTSNIGFIVTDGVLTATSSFVLSVVPVSGAPAAAAVNQAPTISSIADQIIYEGRSNTINFTINDNDGALSCTTTNLSVTSTNTVLVSSAQVVFSGTYPNCTATINLAGGQMGIANLTITVSDGVDSAGSGFQVTGHRINSVAINPLNPIIPRNSNFSFNLTATYSNTQTRSITSVSNWTTSNTAISSFTAAKLLNNTYAGSATETTTVTGSYGAFSASTVGTINSGTITSLLVTPSTASINVNGSVQVSCKGLTSDGGIVDLTNSCSWVSANALIASVNSTIDKGLVIGESLGSATNITATYSSMSASSSVTVDNAPATQSDDGTGLTASYYSGGTNFETFVSSRTDANINFNWLAGINPAGSADSFSVRWTGAIKAPTSGTFTFYTQSDEGVRMWVNGVLIIDNWTAHASLEDSGMISLVAGTKYTIILEYYEGSGQSQIELRYSGPATPKQIIPQSVLFP